MPSETPGTMQRGECPADEERSRNVSALECTFLAGHGILRECVSDERSLTVLGPLVLTADLLLLLGGEVVGDVEGLADFLRRLSLDHVGDSLATNVKEGLDVKVVGGLEID